ncbi:MAG: hypothetical protein ABSC51_01900 [Gaiellaceae bacterium]
MSGLVTEHREGNAAGVDEAARGGEGAVERAAPGSPRPVTPGTSYEIPYVETVRAGIDDITLGLEMRGSRCITRVMELAKEGRATRYGQFQLGHEGEFGTFYNLLDRQFITWSPRSSRLYVQAKLAEKGELTPVGSLQDAVQGLLEKLAILGIVSYEEPFVTRLDVTADGYFENPAIGKALLGAMLSVRLPGQLVARPFGIPMTTVYHSLPSGKVQARCYCRAAKTGEGSTYSLIRLERQKKWEPGEQLLKDLARDVCKAIWDRYFLPLIPESGRCSVLSEEALLMEVRERIKAGSITHAGAERVFFYSKADQLGLAEEIYPKRTLAERRREVRRLGIRLESRELEGLDFTFGDLLKTYSMSCVWGCL